eukprot:6094967-Prymnesium_polylepis.1
MSIGCFGSAGMRPFSSSGEWRGGTLASGTSVGGGGGGGGSAAMIWRAMRSACGSSEARWSATPDTRQC